MTIIFRARVRAFRSRARGCATQRESERLATGRVGVRVDGRIPGTSPGISGHGVSRPRSCCRLRLCHFEPLYPVISRRIPIRKTNRASRALHRRCGEGTPPPRPPKRATPCSARTTLLLMRPRPFRRGRRGRARPATAASTCRRPGRRWTPPPSKICAAGPTPRSPPPSWRASPAGPSRARSFRPSRAESVPFRRLVRLSAASRARPRP